MGVVHTNRTDQKELQVDLKVVAIDLETIAIELSLIRTELKELTALSDRIHVTLKDISRK